MMKNILIPVAAFAVTVTGASAFTGGDWAEKLDIDLTDAQLSALEQAKEVREESREEAKQILEDAGLDEETMQSIREAMHEAREENRAEVKAAIEAGDYEAFKTAIEDSPLAEKITSEADFEKFAEAHELMEAGDREAAKEIMDELGIEKMGKGHGKGHGQMGEGDQGGRGEGRPDKTR